MFKKIISWFLAFTLVVTMSGGVYQWAYATSSTPEPEKQSDQYLSGQAIVVYKSDQLTSNFTARSAKRAINLDSSITIEDTWHFEGADPEDFSKNQPKGYSLKKAPKAKQKNKYEKPVGDVNIALVKSDKLTTEQLIKELKKNPAVESAEPNRIQYKSSINDTYYPHQWAHENHGQHGGQPGVSVNSKSQWDKGNSGKDKIIAIIDTGVDYNHPDLKNSMWENTHYPSLKGKCGYDVAENDSDPMDLDGHGTHCAGIMAAQSNNNLGVSGIAPDAKIMALKAFNDNGVMYTSLTLNAFHYISTAIDLGENVVALNNSWGTGYYQYSVDKLTTLLGQKGVVSVFASGNDSLDVTSDGAESSASFDNPYALFVNSISEDGEPSLFTNYGEETDLFAPGSTILSTVAKPVYNPSIYNKEQQSKFSQKYNDFEDPNNQFAIPKASTLKSNMTNSKATVKIEIVDNKFVGTNDHGKSLKITFDNMRPREFLSVSCPYTRKANPNRLYGSKMSAMVQVKNNLEPTSNKYSEVMISDVSKGHGPKTVSGAYNIDYQLYDQIAGETHSWDHLVSPEDEYVNIQPEPREIIYSVYTETSGPQEIYIDDFGISNTDANPNNFGKYDFYNGTSMAAPYVTGAIALLDDPAANKTATIDGTDRIHQLMSHITKSPSLDNLCETGAYLDLSKTININPKVTKITANKANDTIDISGFGLDQSDITVRINEQAQPILKQEPNLISLKNNGWIGSTVNIEVAASSKILFSKDVSFQAPKKPYNYSAFEYPIGPTDANISTTDGTNIYYGTPQNGNIYMFDTTDGGNYYLGHVDTDGLLDAGNGDETTIGSQLAFADGKLYNVISVDYGIGMDMKLVQMDVKTGKVTDLDYVPEELSKLRDFTMALYNGMIYFIGGYDQVNQETSTQVLAYVPWEDQWRKMDSLPEGRAGGQAFQVSGNKLVYTLGYSEKTRVADDKKQPVNKVVAPENLVLSKDVWSLSSQPAPVIRPTKINNDGNYYDGFKQCVGICSEGLIYAGAPTKNLGDTFIYQVNNDQFIPTEYQLYDNLDFSRFTGIAVNDHFFGNTIDFSVDIPINPGTVMVKGPKYQCGYISGANRPVMPGNKIYVKPVAKKNCFVQSFKVNGQKANLNGRYIRLGSTVSASASFGRCITSIGVKRTQVTMKPGKTYKLNPTVYPANATYKQLTYKSSNPKYITVSPTGLIKTKPNAAGRSATITIKAKSKSNAFKKIYIKVVK